MTIQTLVGKNAYSTEGKYLGKIIRIDGDPEANVISEQPHVIIEVKRFLLSTNKVPLLLSKMTVTDEKDAFFAISIKEFRTLLNNHRYQLKVIQKQHKERERSGGIVNSM